MECGATLPAIVLVYHNYGKLNEKGSNVVWICHALTANSDPMEWWPGLVGEGKIYDPTRHFIVCANTLGSCYGSTNPTSTNPETGEAYGTDFPLLTIRDLVKAHQILKIELGVKSIGLATGGSMGGQQILEWAIMEPNLIQKLVVIGTNARHSPWGIAFNEAQRMAIEADPTWRTKATNAGKSGLEAARALAMLSYRNYEAYQKTQMDDEAGIDDFRASSYQRYQGLKLSRRFSALAYYTLSKAMDTHNLGRQRGSVKEALSMIRSQSLIFGIASDFLFPINEQSFIADHIKGAELHVIDSPFGHDGFLIEFDQISNRVMQFIGNKF